MPRAGVRPRLHSGTWTVGSSVRRAALARSTRAVLMSGGMAGTESRTDAFTTSGQACTGQARCRPAGGLNQKCRSLQIDRDTARQRRTVSGRRTARRLCRLANGGDPPRQRSRPWCDGCPLLGCPVNASLPGWHNDSRRCQRVVRCTARAPVFNDRRRGLYRTFANGALGSLGLALGRPGVVAVATIVSRRRRR